MKTKPCICIFSALYKPSMGGVEIYTEHLAHELTHMGYDTIVVTSNTHGLAPMSVENGVSVYRLPSHALMDGRLPLPKKNAQYQQMLDNLKSMDISFFLVNSRFYPHSHEGIKLAQELGIKPVLLDHGSAYLTLGNPFADTILRSYEHFMTNRMTKHDVDFYGVSEASLRWLEHFGIQGCGTLNNAIDAEQFIAHASDRDFKQELELEDNAFIVAFAGRLVPEKGIDVIIGAAEQLKDHPDIHFILAGDGPKRADIERSSANLHLVGKIPPEDIAALLLEANAFCMPTRSEGFSTSLLEAATCGCAPIITNVGGVSEMIPDPSFGIVLEDASASIVAKNILYLHDHPQECADIGSKLQTRTQELFTWNKTAQQVIQACEQAQKQMQA